MSTPDPLTYSAAELRQPVVRRISTNPIAPLASGGAEDLDNDIGNEDATASPSENTRLHQSASSPSYGTLPEARRRLFAKTSAVRRNLSQLSLRADAPPRARSNSLLVQTPASFRDISFARLSTRPISTYDDPVGSKDEIPDADTKINGIRVWYSSFTSIDWLHDAIKDAARFSRLRKRKSLRSRLRLAFDKSLGWFIVTIVGFITALVAFFVVRSEQLLFDLKEGHCITSWWKAKRFCCPNEALLAYQYTSYLEPENCAAWRTWSDLSTGAKQEYNHAVEFISYTIIALLLALTSTLLTIYLTDSTTFVTRKEPGTYPLSNQAAGGKRAQDGAEPKRKVMYYAAGSGIPEIKTILSGFVIRGYLGGRVLFTKSVGLALSVASGLSLGKEGPFVHIASCVGNIVSRITTKYENNEAKRREILSAACAAGVAVAFGAPIGGTLFSLEEVSYFFPPKVMWRSFFCAMIAAITLKILDPFGTGKLVLFQVTYDKDWHAWELIPFVFLGLFGGIYGAYFSKLNYQWSKNVRNKTFLGPHPIIEVLLITFLTAIFCFLNPYTRMGGTELIYNLFAECRTGSRDVHSGLCVLDPGSSEHVWPVVKAILVAMVVKAGLTVITFGIKLPAGIFIPTLGVGACAGRVMGIAMQYLQARDPTSPLFSKCGGDLDCIIPGLYAMVGAAAALSGVTRTTVSLAVIMFELTDTLTYAVPVMLSVLVAKTVADALEPKGIYDLVIELNQLPYLDAKHEYLWGSLQIQDVLSRDAESLKLDEKQTVQSLHAQLESLTSSGAEDSGFPILRKDSSYDGYRMVGYIGTNELEHALGKDFDPDLTFRIIEQNSLAGLISDETDEEIHFHSMHSHPLASSSISSLQELNQTTQVRDPFDFSPYMDQAPLTLAINSPMELVHQVFVKLGARYIVITDTDGLYEGVLDKKTWLAFLSDLEEKS